MAAAARPGGCPTEPAPCCLELGRGARPNDSRPSSPFPRYAPPRAGVLAELQAARGAPGAGKRPTVRINVHGFPVVAGQWQAARCSCWLGSKNPPFAQTWVDGRMRGLASTSLERTVCGRGRPMLRAWPRATGSQNAGCDRALLACLKPGERAEQSPQVSLIRLGL